MAKLLDVSVGSVRRWIELFQPYLTPGANPVKGQVRVLDVHDQRVLWFITSQRNAGFEIERITERLREMQSAGWAGLPDLPPEWAQSDQTIPAVFAVSKAYDLSQLAVLQAELQHAQTALAEARQRIEVLEAELASKTAIETDLQTQLHVAQLDAEKHRGEVEALRGRLSAYAITGGDKPIPVALIVLVTAIAVAVLVIVLLVVVRLVL